MFRKLLLFVLSSVMIPSAAAAQSRSDYAPSGLGIYNRNSAGDGILQIHPRRENHSIGIQV